MRKRQKFVLSAFVLSLGFVLIQSFNIEWRFQAIAVMTFLTMVFSIWSLKEGLSGIEWAMILLLPPFYTAGVGMFYFLLPSSWVTRLPVALVYGVGMYALLLTENIFTVAAIRTIQLFRAAQAVGFLLTLVTIFFLYDAVWSSRLPFWGNGLLVFALTFPLVLQSLWSVKLDEKISKSVMSLSSVIAFLLAQMAIVLSFWPVTVESGSLFLTACLYVLLGLSQHYIDDRLYPRTIKEYLAVGAVVLLTMYFTTSWTS
jgi:hypothetical protein